MHRDCIQYTEVVPSHTKLRVTRYNTTVDRCFRDSHSLHTTSGGLKVVYVHNLPHPHQHTSCFLFGELFDEFPHVPLLEGLYTHRKFLQHLEKQAIGN